MNKIQITKMSKIDIEAVDKIDQESFSIPWRKSSFEEELNNILATYLVAKIGNEIVGYIGMWFVMDECHITNIAVKKSHRKLGVASKLIQEMYKYCKEHMAWVIMLEVRASNIPAQMLYDKFGFTKDGVRKEYYKNPDGTYEDAILMSKEL